MSGSVVLFRVSSRTNLAGSSPPISFTSSISFASFRLRTLDFSLRSFSHLDPLFSITSALFLQNTRGGIPLRELVRCTKAQKCLSVSPLLATLTHSVSRKSFPCHSYANTRDGGATVAPVSAPTLRFRHHMRHVAPLSPVPSLDCAYFPSPRVYPQRLRYFVLGAAVSLWAKSGGSRPSDFPRVRPSNFWYSAGNFPAGPARSANRGVGREC